MLLLLLIVAGLISPPADTGAPADDSTFYIDSVLWEVRAAPGGSTEGIALLTIDDGPQKDTTRELLDLLAAHDVRALFFINGEPASAFPERVQEMIDGGHMVGNHGWGHKDLATLSADETAREILRVNEWLQQHKDYAPTFFRPPYGISTPAADSIVWDAGMRNMGWSVNSTDYLFPDNEDSVEQDARQVAERTLAGLENGNIILMHDRPVTVEALRIILPELEARGIRLVLPNAW